MKVSDPLNNIDKIQPWLWDAADQLHKSMYKAYPARMRPQVVVAFNLPLWRVIDRASPGATVEESVMTSPVSECAVML